MTRWLPDLSANERKQWRLPAPASSLRLSFIEIKKERGQPPRAVEASGHWWRNFLFVIQIATCILVFSCLMVFWKPFFLISWRSKKGSELEGLCHLHAFHCGSLAYHLLYFNTSAVQHHMEVILCHAKSLFYIRLGFFQPEGCKTTDE